MQAVWQYRAGLVWLGEEPSQSELESHDSSYLGRGHRLTKAHESQMVAHRLDAAWRSLQAVHSQQRFGTRAVPLIIEKSSTD